MTFEVSIPILNSPFEEATAHWFIEDGKDNLSKTERNTLAAHSGNLRASHRKSK